MFWSENVSTNWVLERKTIECGTRYLLENESVCEPVTMYSTYVLQKGAFDDGGMNGMKKIKSRFGSFTGSCHTHTLSREKSKVFIWVHAAWYRGRFLLLCVCFWSLRSLYSAEWRATVFFSLSSSKTNATSSSYRVNFVLLWCININHHTIPTGHFKRKPILFNPITR